MEQEAPKTPEPESQPVAPATPPETTEKSATQKLSKELLRLSFAEKIMTCCGLLALLVGDMGNDVYIIVVCFAACWILALIVLWAHEGSLKIRIRLAIVATVLWCFLFYRKLVDLKVEVPSTIVANSSYNTNSPTATINNTGNLVNIQNSPNSTVNQIMQTPDPEPIGPLMEVDRTPPFNESRETNDLFIAEQGLATRNAKSRDELDDERSTTAQKCESAVSFVMKTLAERMEQWSQINGDCSTNYVGILKTKSPFNIALKSHPSWNFKVTITCGGYVTVDICDSSVENSPKASYLFYPDSSGTYDAFFFRQDAQLFGVTEPNSGDTFVHHFQYNVVEPIRLLLAEKARRDPIIPPSSTPDKSTSPP